MRRKRMMRIMRKGLRNGHEGKRVMQGGRSYLDPPFPARLLTTTPDARVLRDPIVGF